MKKSLVLLAGIGMAFIGLPAVSHAQAASGPFADVPTDHWAYQSVDTLQKAGIVIGYPDGTYGGRRPMTRYEFAVAIARLLAQMNKPTGVSASDLSTLRSDLENQIAGNKAAIDALTTLVNGFQPELTRLGVDVAAADARLDSLEARLGRDEGILGSVVAEQNRFHVTGEVNIIGQGFDSNHRDADGNFTSFQDKNGNRPGFGYTYNQLGNPSGYSNTINGHVLQTSAVYEDILLHLRGKLSDTATANVDLDFGNFFNRGTTQSQYYADSLRSNAIGINSGTSGAFGSDNVYKAYLDAAVKLGPLGGSELLVGRFGNQYTKYTLKLADPDIYTNLTQTDSGDYIGDGAAINLKLGPAKVNAFAVKFNENSFTQPYAGTTAYTGGYLTGDIAAPLNNAGAQGRPAGLTNQAAQISQGIGARVTFGAPESAVLGFTVENFALDNPNYTNGGSYENILTPFDGLTDPNRNPTATNSKGQTTAQYNRLSVYGADFNGALPFGLPGVKKGGLLVDASYTVSAHGINDSFNNIGNGFRYQATDDQLGATFGSLTLKGGYKYIGPDFSAPGYWDRIGSWVNPSNVRGPVGSLKFAFTPKLSLNGDVESYKAAYGQDGQGRAINSPLQQGDYLHRYQVGLGYGLTSAYAVDLGYENVKYDLRNNSDTLAKAGSPTETYITFGIGHTINSNASIKLLYQIVHYDDKGTGFDQTATASNDNGKQDGGIATAQFQLKF